MKNIKLIRPCAFSNVAWTWKACSVCEQQLWTHLRTDWADQIEDMWLAVWVRSANNNKTLIVHTKTAALQFTVSTKCPSQNTIHKSITSFFSCVTAKEFSIHSICLNSLLLKASNILAFFFLLCQIIISTHFSTNEMKQRSKRTTFPKKSQSIRHFRRLGSAFVKKS